MSFKTLKTLLIVLLCVVDIFLGVLLYSQRRAFSQTDGEVIENAVELLDRGGIGVSADELSRLPGEVSVLFCTENGTGTDESLPPIVTSLCGDGVAENFSRHMITNGIRIVHSGGEIFEFYSDGENGAPGRTELLYLSGEEEPGPAAIFASGTELGEKSGKKAAALLGELLLPSGKDRKNRIAFETVAASEDGEGNIALTAVETADGVLIDGCAVTCVIRGDRVTYLSGGLVCFSASEEYTAEMSDRIGVLFAEMRDYLPQSGRERLEVKSCEMVYTPLSAPSDGGSAAGYYLIPSWKIEYDGDIARKINAINGEIY